MRVRHTSTTNDPAVNLRHIQGQVNQRTTHGGPFDPTIPTNGLYGSQVDVEPVYWPDIQGEVVGPGNIQDGAVTPNTFDTEPPEPPTDLTLDSLSVIQPDGTDAVVLRVSWTPSDAPDLNGVYISTTFESLDDGGEEPDWSNERSIFVGKEVSQYDIVGVIGSVQYWVRIRSVDFQGNRSSFTDTESIVTASDVEPPPLPLSPRAVAGFRGAIFQWEPVLVPDLMEYEVRYAVDDGSGTGPDTSDWVHLRTRSTVIWVNGLEPEVQVWFQVQAVDRSSNESGFTEDVIGETECVPTQVGAADIAANSISAFHISASGISADSIKTGLLALGTVPNISDGIEVYNADATTSDKMVGKWDENGIKIFANDDKSDYVHITNASVIIYKNGLPVTAITPDGIDASAITFGRLAGGHNLIWNSSFEVGRFTSDTVVDSATMSTHSATRTSKTGAKVTIDAGAW